MFRRRMGSRFRTANDCACTVPGVFGFAYAIMLASVYGSHAGMFWGTMRKKHGLRIFFDRESLLTSRENARIWRK